MEFQHKAWREVLANRPKYIITIAPSTSFVWDGKADMWILRQTKHLIKANYYLEAAVTVGEPKGRLILFDKTDQAPMQGRKFLA